MADKMLRVAGRGADGTAKGISVDNTGNILLSDQTINKVAKSNSGHTIILSESDSSQGREIAGSTTWESPIFDVADLETLHVGTSVNIGNQYTVSVKEYSHIGSKLFELKTTDLSNGAVTGNVLEHMRLMVETTKIRIYLKNNAVTPIRIGLIAYGGRIKTNTFYNQEKRKFEFQSQYATEETLKKIAQSNTPHTVLMNEPDSAHGRDVAGNQTWESEFLDVTEIDSLYIGTGVSGANPYTVTVKEYSLINTKAVELKSTLLTKEAVVSNKLFSAAISTASTAVKIFITNTLSSVLRIGLVVYTGRAGLGTYYNEDKKEFETQPKIATEQTLEKVVSANSGHTVILSESDSSQGREILGTTTWESPIFDVTDLESLHIGTSLSTGNVYNLTVKEYSHIGSKIFETNVADLTNGAVKGNVLRSMPLRTDTTKVRIYVANLDTTPTRVGIVAYGGKIKPNTFYNQEKTVFDTQTEIATESTLTKIFNQLLNQSRSILEKKYPVLSDVKIIENTPVLFIAGSDGEYFYAGDAERQGKLLRSKDGVEWELIHTFNHIGGSLTMVMVGDEGHMTVGFGSGYVYVSDENGVFPSEPTIITSAIEAMFGRFKHANVMGFNSYAPHGFDDGQKHEAFLSTDNGKTYKKVFNNTTFSTLPPLNDNQVHLHDFEYDPYSGRLYLWIGDFENRALNYSDNWGETWTQVFTRGEIDNVTQLIATKNGLALGADTGGGGYAFLPLDRSNIKSTLDINDYMEDYWTFNRDGGRFIAGRSFVDRKNNIYLTPYITEPTTGLNKNHRTGYLAYSDDGENWSIIWQSPDMNDWTGLETIEYINGVLVGTYSKGGDDRPLSTFIAKVDLS